MSDTFNMPKDFGELCEQYAFHDIKEIYTNGSELIQTYRVEQWIEMNGIEEALKKQATKQATSNYTSEWIPVSERLPEELVAVNVTWINRCPENYYMHIKDKPFTDTAVLYQGEWYWWDSTIIDYLSECGTCISGVVNKSIDILAWQPLPEPMRLEKRDD